MSAAVEGTGKETFYTSHGVRLGKIVAFNPRDSKWYLRAMKYKPSGGGYWAKKGDRIVSSKKGLWWGSKEEAMQLSSIEKWLQALQPATRGGTRGRSRRKQAAPTKKAAAQVQEKFPAQEGKGRDLLDLLAELKAEDVLGTKMGGAEFMEKVFAEGSKQVRVAAKRRRKQFGNRRKERQEKKSEAEAELKDERREWRVKHIEAFSGFMDRGDCSRIIDGDSAPMAGLAINLVQVFRT
jgi:hypothetical protein